MPKPNAYALSLLEEEFKKKAQEAAAKTKAEQQKQKSTNMSVGGSTSHKGGKTTKASESNAKHKTTNSSTKPKKSSYDDLKAPERGRYKATDYTVKNKRTLDDKKTTFESDESKEVGVKQQQKRQEYKDYKKQLREEHPTGEWLKAEGNAAAWGLDAELAKTADFLLPDAITPKAVQRAINYYKAQGEKSQQEVQEARAGDWERTLVGTVGGESLKNLPSATMAMLSGGTSVAAQTGATLLNPETLTHLGNTFTRAMGSVVQEVGTNPMFWETFSRTLGTTYENEIANGATPEQATLSAFVNSLLNAQIEVGGGIETFNPSEDFVTALLRTAKEEGSEEIIQGIVENLTHKAVGSNMNVVNTYTDVYKDPVTGEVYSIPSQKSYETPWFSLNPDETAVINPIDLAKQGFYGAASGGLMGGGRTVINNIGTNAMDAIRYPVSQSQIQQGLADTQSLVSQGLVQGRQGVPSKAEQLAQEMQSRIDRGEEVTAAQVKSLVRAITKSRDINDRSFAYSRTKNALQAMENGEYTDYKYEGTNSESIEREGYFNAKNQIREKYADRVADVLGVEDKTDPGYRTAIESISRVLSGDAESTDIDNILMDSKIKAAYEEVANQELPRNNAEARKVLEDKTNMSEIANRKEALQMTWGEKATELEAGLTANLEKNGHQVFIENLEKGEAALGKANYSQIFDQIYSDATVSGVTVEEEVDRIKDLVKGFPSAEEFFNEARIRQIFFAGKADTAALRSSGKLQTKTTEQNATKPNRRRKGKLTIDQSAKGKIDSNVEAALKTLAKNIKGLEIVVVDHIDNNTKNPNAHINGMYKDGVITVALDSTNPLVTVAKHELTHWIKENNPEGYNKLEDFVFEKWYHGNNAEMQRAIREYTNLYRDLTVQEIKEEIIADATESFFTDQETVNEVVNYNKSLGKTIRDGIRSILNGLSDLRQAQGNPKDRGYSKFLKDLGILTEAESMWTEALEGATKGTPVPKVSKNKPSFNITLATTPAAKAIQRDAGKTLDEDVFRDKNGKPLLLSGFELTEQTLREMGKAAEWDVVGKFLNRQADLMKKRGEVYKFIGLNDINNAVLQVRRDKNGDPTSIVVSAMVKNGEYPVNFDFSSICKKREALSKLFEKLSTGENEGFLDTVELTPSNLWEINKLLSKSGFETACLGCFVESKRYQIESWADSFVEKWNNAVREINPNAEYFNLATTKDIDYGTVGEEIEKFRENKKAEIKKESTRRKAERTRWKNTWLKENPGKSEKDAEDAYKQWWKKKYNKKEGDYKDSWFEEPAISNDQAVNALVNSDKKLQKLLKKTDLISPKGLKDLMTLHPDFYGVLYGNYGSGTPKPTIAFTPYNSEVALLGRRANADGTMQKLTKKSNDKYVQKMYAIGGVRMQSFSDFLIQNVFDYMQMVADLSARDLPAHAYTKEIAFAKIFGMTGIKINLSVMFDVDPEGIAAGLDKDGNYVVADKARQEREAKKGNHVFAFSIDFNEAVKLQNKEGYDGNVGIIGVGLSDLHIRKMLNDINIKQIIPFHSSSMPEILKKQAHLDEITDYTSTQNTLKITKITKDGKDVTNQYGTDYMKRLYEKTGSWKAAFAQFRKDTKGCEITTEKAFDSVGKFPLYTGDTTMSLDMTNNPKLTAEYYMGWCIDQGCFPLFYQFADEENYYKVLYDFNVYHNDGTYAPQTAVENNYPTDLNRTVDYYMNKANNYAMRQEPKWADTIDKTKEILEKNSYLDEAKPKHSLSATDQAYMDAVNKGDMETAAKMVREAARRNGFNSPMLFHGTRSFGFTKIDLKAKGNYDNYADGFSFWASSRPEVSGTYTTMPMQRGISEKVSEEILNKSRDYVSKKADDKIHEFRRLIDKTFSEWVFGQQDDSYIRELFDRANPESGWGDGVYDAFDEIVVDAFYEYQDDFGEYEDIADWQENAPEAQKIYDAIVDLESLRKQYADSEYEGVNDTEGIYRLYANTDNMFVVDGEGKHWNNLYEPMLKALKTANAKVPFNESRYRTRDIAIWAKKNGYTGVIFKNIYDNGEYGGAGLGDVYAFLEPNRQVKSADPVTYDDEGNVIPLSERFSEKDELRYSLSNDYTIKDGTARWTDERIWYLTQEYGGGGNYSSAYAVLMNPRDFLKLTLSDSNLERWNTKANDLPDSLKGLSYKDMRDKVIKTRKESGEYINEELLHPLDTERLKDERQTPFLIIYSDEGTMVWGHEGRHRMRALAEAGVKSVPVVIRDTDTKYTKKPLPSMTLSAQDFGHGAVNNNAKVTVKDLVPIRNDNIDELKAKFGGEADIKYQLSPAEKENRSLKKENEKLKEGIWKKNEKIAAEKWKNEVDLERLRRQHRAAAEAKRARREESEIRTKLLNIARRLDKLKTTRDNQELIQSYIGELDLVAKSMTGKTLKDLQELSEWYKEQQKEDPFFKDPIIEKKLERLNTKQKQIGKMDIEDVKDLLDILKNIENNIRTQNKFVASEDRRTVKEAGLQVIKDINKTKGIDTTSTLGKFDTFFINGTLSPMRLIRRLTGYKEDDPMYLAAQELSNGQREMFDYQRRAWDMFKRWTNDKKFVASLNGKKARPIKLMCYHEGQPKIITVTPDIAISLYLSSKNEDNMNHIGNGGVNIPDFEEYRKGNLQKAYSVANRTRVQFNKAQLQEIEDRLTTKEKAFADTAFEYYNEVAPEAINRVSEILKGYSLARVKNYFPINVDKHFLTKDFEALKFDGTIEGMGSLKERVQSYNPIEINGIVNTLTKSIKENSMYVGLAIPVRNMNKLLGVRDTTWTEKDRGGRPDIHVDYDGSVNESIEARWGEPAMHYIEKFMTDLQTSRTNYEDWDKLLNELRSNYAGSVLTTNAGVAMKQAASYPAAVAVLGLRPTLRALGNIGRVDLDRIAEYTPLQWYRSQGYSTTELGEIRAGRKDSFVDKVTSKTIKVGDRETPIFNWIQGMDLATTRKLWKASEYYVRQHNKNLERGSNEYYEAVADIYNRVIEETQPNYTTMQRPQLLRSDSSWIQMLNMFKTQPYQNLNIVYDAYGNYVTKANDYKNNKTAENKAKARKAYAELGNAVLSQMLQLATFAAMTFAWAFLRGKDDKWRDEETGKITLESFMKRLAHEMLSGTFAVFPFGGDIFNLFSKDYYYGYQSVTDASLNDLGNTVRDLVEFSNMAYEDLGMWLQGDREDIDTQKLRKMFDKISKECSRFFGVPYDNARKLFDSMYRWAMIAANGKYVGEYMAAKETLKDASTKRNILYMAYRNDPEQYEALRQQMIEDGFDADQLDSDLNSWRIDNMTKEETEKYNESLGKVKGTSAWAEATDEERKDYERTLKKHTLGIEDSTTESVQKYADKNELSFEDAIVGKLNDKRQKEKEEATLAEGMSQLTDTQEWQNLTEKQQQYYKELLNEVLNGDDSARAEAIRSQAVNGKTPEDVLHEAMIKEEAAMKVLSPSPLWQEATDDDKERYELILRKIALGIEDSTTTPITKKVTNGLTDEQVILYGLALRKADKPNANGNMGTYTNAEKKEALQMLMEEYGLTAEQQSTLTGIKN